MGKLPAYLEFLAQVTFDEFLHYWKKICFEKNEIKRYILYVKLQISGMVD